MRIREIMTEPVETITPSLPIDQAAGLMRALRVHHLVVKEGSKTVGVLSASDLPKPGAAHAAGDERTGLLILKHALEAPARQIAENSGVDGGVVVDRMVSGTGAYGFDASRSTYVDLVDAGIIDPTKVIRAALENAVSVASVLLLTEATLTDIPEPKSEHPATAEMMP